MVVLFSSTSKHFLQSIKHIYFIQILMGVSRCLIRGNSVYSKSVLQSLWLAIWVLASPYLFYNIYYIIVSDKELVGNFTNWFLRFCVTISTFIIHLVNLKFTSKYAVKLLKLCSNLHTFNWKLEVRTIGYTDLAVLGLSISLTQKIITTLLVGPKYYTDGIFSTVIMFVLDIDILLWTKICNYLRLSFWNINYILKHIKTCLSKSDSNARTVYSYSKLTKLILGVERSLFSYDLLTKIYNWLLALFYTNFFIWSMSCVHKIFNIKDKNPQPDLYTSMILKAFEKMVILICISVSGELLKKETENVKKLCLEILDYNENGAISECAKKIIWLLQELPPNFTVYGLLQLDCKLPFQLLSLIFVYAVVLLQFIMM